MGYYHQSLNMKKRLILVGNKPFECDRSAEIDAMDFVVRVNRMNNYGLSGTRIDGYFLGLYTDFVQKYHGGAHRREIRRARQVFCQPRVLRKKPLIFDFISMEQYAGIETTSWEGCIRDTGIRVPTSTMLVLHHLLTTHWAEEYDVWLTGVDIEGRGQMFRDCEEWNTTRHRDSGVEEEAWLRRLVNDEKIKML